MAQRPALDDAHDVAHFGAALFVVRVEFLALVYDPLVQRMRHPAAHFHHYGLGHLGRDHLTDLLVLQRLAGLRGHITFSPRLVPAPSESCRCGRGPSSWHEPFSGLPWFPWTSGN